MYARRTPNDMPIDAENMTVNSPINTGVLNNAPATAKTIIILELNAARGQQMWQSQSENDELYSVTSQTMMCLLPNKALSIFFLWMYRFVRFFVAENYFNVLNTNIEITFFCTIKSLSITCTLVVEI